ncbi:Stk1 family PASTA domain-containing Ser/Thr kinase [Paenisporosarcina sp. OV554]|uniref:Stk1 family PASTA domain-containing Ser/Thr kinase n=1 Tax=Paenisporosarcina sp. OV554 TaxID=2135694 RepID=UPI000D3AE9F9|nr:Stk1 family PASTA domain-containing Ser/Thr kinase [Paenisporosarcina sp. OV554]PUB18131.1 serine/threonine-protein kinase [Paenisporosarcina sp. OV554]
MLLGKRISGRYKVIEMIGGGGMSNVYLAHDMILDRDVAIKVLRYDFSNEDDLHRRFQREALSATSLTHPNIVNIFDVGEDRDLQYLVMEFVEGKTLKHYIVDNAPLSPDETVRIMKQLTSAIAHAHQNQIIHRDIKPQNILMDGVYHVKITDFGIAMALSATSFTQTNSVLGTVHYLSPEQARGGTATKQSDIYALGIVLYELLTGKLPFSGESAVSIALKHLQTETPSVRAVVPTIPQSLENVVMKATSKDPRNRYQTVEEMEHDLNNVLSAERANEAAFAIPYDDDATKAMPVIKEGTSYDKITETKQHTKEQVFSKPVVEEKKKKKKWPWVLGIISLLLLTSVIVIIAFPGMFGPEKIEVPDVANKSLNEAIDKVEEVGFIAGNETEESSEEIEEGKVIRTIPENGKIREEGTEIDFIISSGKELVSLPDYEGRDINEVRELLAEQNFKSIETVEEFSQEPVGTIISQEPSGDSELIPDETELVFVVSKGQELYSVIDLTKQYNEKTLNDYAKSSGFNIRIVNEEFSADVPEGFVISQKPVAGTQLEPGSSIDIVLSKGPVAKKVKTFIKSVEIPYEPETEGAEQIVRIYLQDQTHSLAEPVEEFVLTESKQQKIQLEIEEGQKGAYRIMVDSKVIEDEIIEYDSFD